MKFVDDRPDDLEAHVDNPEHFDKLGNPHAGRLNPGRCHVCLAWVAYPYSEGSLTVCPGCHGKGPGERELVRERVRDALADVWEGST